MGRRIGLDPGRRELEIRRTHEWDWMEAEDARRKHPPSAIDTRDLLDVIDVLRGNLRTLQARLEVTQGALDGWVSQSPDLKPPSQFGGY